MSFHEVDDGQNCNEQFYHIHEEFPLLSPPFLGGFAARKTIITRKGSEYMSDKEKEILRSISDTLPNLSDMDKGYVLGVAEGMAIKKDDVKETERNKQ